MLQAFVEVVSNNWNEKGGQGTLKGPRRGGAQAKKFTTSSLWGKGGGKE